MKVVGYKSLPMRMPLVHTAVAYLLLDRLGAPDVAWGIAGTLFAILWIAWIVTITHQEQVDLFPPDEKIKVTRGISRDAADD